MLIVYPGTFDPFTLGHLDLIERAYELTDQLLIAVAEGAHKKTWLSIEQRVHLIQTCVQHLAKVQVVSFNGLMIDFLKKQKAHVVLRGIRNATDFDYEQQLAHTYKLQQATIESIFMLPKPELASISSSFVRQIAELGGDISNFVPKVIIQQLAKTQY